MIIFKTIESLRAHLHQLAGTGLSIGFVPTMGALHEGHLQLVRTCKAEQGCTIASIFINPTQFNDPADFDKYPVTVENDIRLLVSAGCDLLFLPAVSEMYPNGFELTQKFELGDLENILEGFYRPGHFQGVCQVVSRLLRIVCPNYLYLGRKDYQQCMVIKKMLEITGLKVKLQIVPTVREANGLAMSSRNLRLSETEREQAGSIYRQLQFIQQNVGEASLATLAAQATSNLLDDGFQKVDYVAVAEPDTFAPVVAANNGKPFVVLIAAFLNGVRLIDNKEITP